MIKNEKKKIKLFLCQYYSFLRLFFIFIFIFIFIFYEHRLSMDGYCQEKSWLRTKQEKMAFWIWCAMIRVIKFVAFLSMNENKIKMSFLTFSRTFMFKNKEKKIKLFLCNIVFFVIDCSYFNFSSIKLKWIFGWHLCKICKIIVFK